MPKGNGYIVFAIFEVLWSVILQEGCKKEKEIKEE